MTTRRLFFIVAMMLVASTVNAKVKLAKVFSNDMVLQREKPVNVWGTADAGERITVRVNKQTVRTKAGADGQWKVKLKPMAASSKAVNFSVTGEANRIDLHNVLVGEVWLASGQSNMFYSMNDHPQYAKPKKGDADRLLHEYDKGITVVPYCFTLDKQLFTEPLTLVFSGASCKTEIEAVQDNRTLPVVTLKDKTLIDFNPFGGPIRINTRK